MADNKHRVLFVCAHNAARGQMAEVFLQKYGGGDFEAESAGPEAGALNSNVITVMQEAGFDLSGKTTRSVFDLFQAGRLYDAVIAVCDQETAERCPIFPGYVKRITWSIKDPVPSAFHGTDEEILQHTRTIRDRIEQTVLQFVDEARPLSFWL